MDNDLPAQVDVLKALIEKEEENYKLAIKQNAEYETLKKIREQIRNLKNDLQALDK